MTSGAKREVTIRYSLMPTVCKGAGAEPKTFRSGNLGYCRLCQRFVPIGDDDRLDVHYRHGGDQ